MTNSPFDDLERPVWEKGFRRDDRFAAALRIDPLLVSWPEAAGQRVCWGYRVQSGVPSRKTLDEVRRFLADWTKRMNAHYVMVSLPAEFPIPDSEVLRPD